jgi:hypothetical protein
LVKMGVVKKRYDPREQIPFWAIDHDRLNELERETLTLSVKDPDTECQHPDTEWRQ